MRKSIFNTNEGPAVVMDDQELARTARELLEAGQITAEQYNGIVAAWRPLQGNDQQAKTCGKTRRISWD